MLGVCIEVPLCWEITSTLHTLIFVDEGASGSVLAGYEGPALDAPASVGSFRDFRGTSILPKMLWKEASNMKLQFRSWIHVVLKYLDPEEIMS